MKGARIFLPRKFMDLKPFEPRKKWGLEIAICGFMKFEQVAVNINSINATVRKFVNQFEYVSSNMSQTYPILTPLMSSQIASALIDSCS